MAIDPVLLRPTHPVLTTPVVWHNDIPPAEPAVLLLRRAFSLGRHCEGGVLFVTACQRFVLSLDGRELARGPSRADPDRWGFVRVDLPTLAPGDHLLTATAWQLGSGSGKAQLGDRGFFLVATADEALAPHVHTGEAWRVWHDRSRTPVTKRQGPGRGHTAVGAGECVNASLHPTSWDQPGYDDAHWPAAKVICKQAGNPWGNRPLGCHLRPDPLPEMRRRTVAWHRIADGAADAEWLTGDTPMTIPPGKRARLVLDRGAVTNAYLRLRWSGGEGSTVRIVTCEAPVDEATKRKGDRDDLAGKALPGMVDKVLPGPAGSASVWDSLWFRSFRYLELTVETAEQPLELYAPGMTEASFPLETVTQLGCAGGGLADDWPRMMTVGRRTAEMCSHETFFDCPHYEQGQFPGDARIQARYHYLIANDDRLPRKAIDDLHSGRRAHGLLNSHYPARMHQIISTYSLQWIGMLHDFVLYRGDAGFVRPYLPAALEVLQWFLDRRTPQGLVGPASAPFLDWCDDFEAGNAPQTEAGESAIITVMVAEACGWLADLVGVCEPAAALMPTAEHLLQVKEGLIADTLAACWDGERGCLADTPGKDRFSVHAQVQAVLAGAWDEARGRECVLRALQDDAFAQPGTLYYRSHLAQALRRVGLGDRVVGLFNAWREMLDGTGLTTWPEGHAESRSDCHGWSVMPEVEFIHSVLGVTPCFDHAGFARVHLMPNLGELGEASGQLHTPRGVIDLRLRPEPSGVLAEIDSPVPVAYTYGMLDPGRHTVTLNESAGG